MLILDDRPVQAAQQLLSRLVVPNSGPCLGRYDGNICTARMLPSVSLKKYVCVNM